jgi:hypothetical protein
MVAMPVRDQNIIGRNLIVRSAGGRVARKVRIDENVAEAGVYT